MDHLAVLAFHALEEDFGSPLLVTSAYRCDRHNTDVGGKKLSTHMQGIAFDISMAKASQPKLLLLAHKHGFHGIGVAPHFVHIDLRESEASWTYPDTSKRS
jgi:uncharacterized protein YcbK (DUF882 family)